MRSQSLVKNGVRLDVIGRRDRLPDGIATAIARAEAATARGTTLHLRIAVDYSARDAILNAAAKAAALTSLTREAFSQLVTGEPSLRDVDLIIRTSGEKRLSDFLLWEGAYAELISPSGCGRNSMPAISPQRSPPSTAASDASAASRPSCLRRCPHFLERDK